MAERGVTTSAVYTFACPSCYCTCHGRLSACILAYRAYLKRGRTMPAVASKGGSAPFRLDQTPHNAQASLLAVTRAGERSGTTYHAGLI